MNAPPTRASVTPALITLAHNAQCTTVALYGEMLSEQEKRLQQLTSLLGTAQQECAKLAAACATKDALIKRLESLTEKMRDDLDEPDAGPERR